MQAIWRFPKIGVPSHHPKVAIIIWRFPKIGVPSHHPKVAIINGKANGVGYPYFFKLPYIPLHPR